MGLGDRAVNRVCCTPNKANVAALADYTDYTGSHEAEERGFGGRNLPSPGDRDTGYVGMILTVPLGAHFFDRTNTKRTSKRAGTISA